VNVIKRFRIKSFKKDNQILKLRDISLFFDKRKILENINLDLNEGQILGLLGPNGVGKSTIFNIIIG
jgi:lipopolysaccharide export system ATP-binding protein